MSKLFELRGRLHLYKTEDGGRKSPFLSGYRPMFNIGGRLFTGMIILENHEKLCPGDAENAIVYFIYDMSDKELLSGMNLTFGEGPKSIGDFLITEVNGLVTWEPETLNKMKIDHLMKEMENMITSKNIVDSDILASQLIDEGIKSEFSNKEEVHEILDIK